jgi:flagellar biogenesis protein FliO
MYNWIQNTFQVGESVAQGLALIISLAVVLALFGLFIFIIKRLMGGRITQSRGRQPRIGLMDSAAIDNRRRLLLVRRDNIEHLILVGGPTDVVVEQNIIRNTPLAAGQTRTSTHQAAAQAGGIKAPLAPGPDIPLTPEDSAAAQQPHQAPDLKAPAQAAPSTAMATAPVPAPAIPVESTPKAPSTSALPPRQVTQPSSPAAPAKPQTLAGSPRPSMGSISQNKSAQPASPRPVEQTTAPSSANAQTPPVTVAPASPVSNDKAPPLSASTVNEAKPEPDSSAPVLSATKDEAPKPASRLSNSLSSLARPFSPKDRPSYGSAKISPPASGPAARAKTALVTPVETDSSQKRVEPVLTPNTNIAPQSQETLQGSNQQAEKPKLGAEAEHAVEHASDPEKPKDISSSAEKADLTNAMAESIEKELFDEPATTTTGTEPHRVEASASEPTEEKPAGIVVETKETDEKKDAHDVSEPDKTAAAAENTGEDKKEIGTGKQTQTQHDQGIGDRNPIEAEMAKILDELGGQPKQ